MALLHGSAQIKRVRDPVDCFHVHAEFQAVSVSELVLRGWGPHGRETRFH